MFFFGETIDRSEYSNMTNDQRTPTWGGRIMEIFIPFGIVAVWIILQMWVLPRFGVNT
jgi:hypothetical protein